MGSGMRVCVDLSQALPIHVGVNLCGGNLGMAQDLLDDAQVGASRQHVRGKAVAHRMGSYPLLNAGARRR